METVENILWGIKIPSPYYDLAPINQYDYNLKLTFMKTLSNSPPPFKIGEFDLIFLLLFQHRSE